MRKLVWGVAVVAAIAGGPAYAQMDSRDAIALQNQILALQRDVQALRQNGGGAPAPSRPDRGSRGGDDSGLTAQLLDRVSTLEDQVRDLRGQVDRLNNQLQRQGEDLKKQIGDLAFAAQNAAPASTGRAAPVQALTPPASNLGTVPAQPATPTGQVPRTAEIAMQEGNAALARRDYPVAEAAAREVLGSGRGPRATDAQFLLAQSLTGKRDYQGAAIAYDDAYNRSRTGSRAPEALLGVANAMVQLNERGAACASLDKLRAEFKEPRPEIRDAAATLRARAGCR